MGSMKWLKENVGWIGTSLAILVLFFGWASGYFGSLVETKAAPIAHSVAREEIKYHALEVEPRMQAVETLATGNRQKLVDIERKMDTSLEMQKKILAEITKK